MPASVILMPAFASAVMAPVLLRVNENVAVVAVLLALEASVISNFCKIPQCTCWCNVNRIVKRNKYLMDMFCTLIGTFVVLFFLAPIS